MAGDFCTYGFEFVILDFMGSWFFNIRYAFITHRVFGFKNLFNFILSGKNYETYMNFVASTFLLFEYMLFTRNKIGIGMLIINFFVLQICWIGMKTGHLATYFLSNMAK